MSFLYNPQGLLIKRTLGFHRQLRLEPPTPNTPIDCVSTTCQPIDPDFTPDPDPPPPESSNLSPKKRRR